jgi:hypothetical protein
MKRQIEYPRQASMCLPDVINPFHHRLELGILDTIKVGIV